MKKYLLVVAVCLFVINMVQAHETYVMPVENKEYKAGDTVTLAHMSTHYFTVGEELEPVEVNVMTIVKNGSRGNPLRLTANNDRLWYEATYTLTDNTPVIVEGNRLGGFYGLFTDGGYADGTRAQVTAANPGKTIATMRYFAKYSKFYLNPAANDRTFSTPLGHELEIIPLDNPAGIKRGSSPRFRVLYKGQPLPNAEISATYDYYDYKTVDNYAKKGMKTDSKGEVTVKIDNSGLWYVRVRDSRRSAHPNTDEDVLSAIVGFTVK